MQFLRLFSSALRTTGIKDLKENRKSNRKQPTATTDHSPLHWLMQRLDIRSSLQPQSSRTQSPAVPGKKMKLNKIITSQGWLIFSQPTSPTIWSLQKPPVCHHAHGTPLSPNCSRCVQGDSFPMCFPTKSQLLQHLKFYYAAAFKASNQDHHTSDTLSHQ